MHAAPDIATVTLNAAIDQTAIVPNFAPGAVNRVINERSDVGGKGINVASFLTHFGHKVAVTGVLGRVNIESFTMWFSERGIIDRFVRVDGRTRVNVKVVDEIQKRVTEINFPGLQGIPQTFDAVIATVESLAASGTDRFVLSGSLPKGVPVDAYRTLVERLKTLGKFVVVDTSGPSLRLAIEAAPDVVKPNISEFQELTGKVLTSNDVIVGAARSLVGRGIGLVAVSLGSAGALFVTKDEAVYAIPPQIAPISTVGAGDAMVAGIVHGTILGLSLDQLAACATAFSVSTLGETGPRLPPPEIVNGFETCVIVQSI